MKKDKNSKGRAAAKLAKHEKLKQYQQMALKTYQERMEAEKEAMAKRREEEGWLFFWDDKF